MQKAARETPGRLFCVSILFFLTSSGAGVSHSAPYGRAPEVKNKLAVKGPPIDSSREFLRRGFWGFSPRRLPSPVARFCRLKKVGRGVFPRGLSCHSKGPRRGPGKIFQIEGGRMAESLVFNMDCMEGMRQFPDGFFDLAVVDPPYGGGACSQSGNVERERERAARRRGEF
jgi:hypothetical protein